MPLEYDSHTSEIRYEGKVVGRYDHKDGKARVSLNLTYECAPEDGSFRCRGLPMGSPIWQNTIGRTPR